MDLRTQRLVRPEPDSVMLAPHHSLFLGAFSAQHCSQDSQKHLPQHIHVRSPFTNFIVEIALHGTGHAVTEAINGKYRCALFPSL